MKLTAVLKFADEGGFIAMNPETGTTTQGETVEEALANLREATALYLEEFPLVARRQARGQQVAHATKKSLPSNPRIT